MPPAKLNAAMAGKVPKPKEAIKIAASDADVKETAPAIAKYTNPQGNKPFSNPKRIKNKGFFFLKMGSIFCVIILFQPDCHLGFLNNFL